MRWLACTVFQQVLWLYSVICSGRLGVDRNKGHEIVMRQCDAGNYDDREAAGKHSISPWLSKMQGWLTCLSLQPNQHLPSCFAFCCRPVWFWDALKYIDSNSSLAIMLFHTLPHLPLSGDLLSISKKSGLWADDGAAGGAVLTLIIPSAYVTREKNTRMNVQKGWVVGDIWKWYKCWWRPGPKQHHANI